jgi:hypothetical protein
MFRDFFGLKDGAKLLDMGGLTFGSFRSFLQSQGDNQGVGTDQTKGFDTCIDQEDQESWTNRLIRRLRKLRERELGQA